MHPTRRAVIDIGTNSVKLLVAEVTGGVVTPLEEKSEQTRLGRGFYEDHRLRPEAIEHTAKAVADFAKVAQTHKVISIRVIATSAARDAINAQDLTGAVLERAGLKVRIISGEQEADWAFLGVLTAPELADHALLILDVGGGSTEFIVGDGHHCLFRESFPLGTVRLLEAMPVSDPPTQTDYARCREKLDQQIVHDIKPKLMPTLGKLLGRNPQLVGTGGTTAILARMEQRMTDFNRDRIEATRLSRLRVQAHRETLWGLPLEARKQIIGLPPNRADVILYGVSIYEALMEHLAFPELRISTRGLRYAAVLQPS